MTPELWQRIESLLQRALELPPSESEAFLHQTCGDDAVLRKHVESLIRADQRAGRFMARPIFARTRETELSTVEEPLGRLPAADNPENQQGSSTLDSLDEGLYPPGTILAGRYRIVSFLGRGGMGEVYRADDLKLDQAVALKLLQAPMERDPASRSRLLAEVRIARRISHPNVCRVHDIGEADGRHFLSMEYIEGEDLASLLQRIGRLPRDKAIEIGQQLCHGLAAAHEQGVLHRDLKPSNLMIDGQGRARITDFGIAASAGGVTGKETRRGTPLYMAPEQIAGQEVTIRSDLYALGLVLYELFTGQRAVRDRSIEELIRRQQEASLVPPAQWVPGLDTEIEEAILSCVASDPRDRPESAEAVAAALMAHTTGREWLPAPGLAIPYRSSWILDQKLGAGNFGEVWLAGHRKTGERRVFKLGRGAAGRRALRREIAIFRLLKEGLGDRDDLARILDWNIDEPPYFIESEYTQDGNLLEWAEARGGIEAVPLAIRLGIVAQVATALAAAHSVGVLHKNVKPSNVLIAFDREPESSAGRLRAQLIDFGHGAALERPLVEASTRKPDEMTGGTRLYVAPELVEGKAATLQSDVYALGVVLYQVVVGDFSRVLAPAWWRDVDDEHLRQDIADAVDGSPERRLVDARELARRLRSLDERRAERARRRRSREATKRTREALGRSHRRWQLAAVAIGVLTMMTAVLGLLANLIAREKQRAEREAAKAKNIARIAVAGEWLHRDPTQAALVLLEVEDPETTAYAMSLMRRVLSQRLATVELRGHEGPIQTARWSPQGDRIVTTSPDRTARVWSVSGGQPIVLEHDEQLVTAWFDPRGERIITLSVKGTARRWHADGSGGTVIFEGPDSRVQAAAMSPHADRVITGSWAGAVRLRHLDTSAEPIHLGSHDGPVTAASFSPRGDRIVTASRDGTARIWDTGGSRKPVVLQHDRALRAVLFSPRGHRVLTVCTDDTVRVWDAGGSVEPMVFKVGVMEDSLVDASWGPDGERIVVGSRGTARVWKADGSGEPIVLTGHRDTSATAFSPRGDRVLVASGYGSVRVWDAKGTGDPIVLTGHHGVVGASFGPRGENILTASSEGTVRVWDVGRPTEPAVLEHTEPVRHASWSPRGDRIMTVPRSGAVRVWNGDGSGEPTLLGDPRDAVLSTSWGPRGVRLATASGDGTARVWRTDAVAEPIVLVGHADRVLTVSWSPRGERLVTASGDGSARVWNADGSGEPVVLRAHGDSVTAAWWSPDGDLVITASGNDTAAFLWSPDGSGKPIVLDGHEALVDVVSFAPRGGRVLTASSDGTARVWNVDGSGEPIVLGGHDDFILAAVFAPDGDRIVTATAGGTIHLWNVQAPGESLVLAGHRSAVNAVSWNPEGDRFVTVSEDGTAKIWSAGSGEPMVLEGHTGPVVAASWSPDGDRILTASRDGTARVWRIDTSDLIAALKAATRVCLYPEFREQHLGDSPEEARRRYLDCDSARPRRLDAAAEGIRRLDI